MFTWLSWRTLLASLCLITWLTSFSAGDVLWRVGVSRAQLAGFSWEPLALGSLRARAAFLTDGELGWLADDKGRLHVTGGVSPSLPRGVDGVWKRVSPGDRCSLGRWVKVRHASARGGQESGLRYLGSVRSLNEGVYRLFSAVYRCLRPETTIYKVVFFKKRAHPPGAGGAQQQLADGPPGGSDVAGRGAAAQSGRGGRGGLAHRPRRHERHDLQTPHHR